MGKKSSDKKARRDAVEKARALGFDDAAIEAMHWDSELGLLVDREAQAYEDGNRLPPVVCVALLKAIKLDDVAMFAASIADCRKCEMAILDIRARMVDSNGQEFGASVLEVAIEKEAGKCIEWLIHYGIKSKITKIEDDCFQLIALLEGLVNHGRHDVLAESLVQAYVDLGQINLSRTKLNQRRGADLLSYVEFSAILERHAARLVKGQLLKHVALPVLYQSIATTSSSKGMRL